jgi:hypothetical protein
MSPKVSATLGDMTQAVIGSRLSCYQDLSGNISRAVKYI